jgi:Ca-activated chloride channel family protein
MKASVRLDHNLIAVDGEHDVHAMLELVVPEADDGAERPPLRLALVLDRSGSMGGPKLEIAKRCAAWLVSRLKPTDELALVDYDDDVRLLAPLGPVDQHALAPAIGSIYPGGSTNLSGGWLKGLEQLQARNGDGPRKILLLTDGLANVGITDPGQLVGIAKTAGEEGIGTSTIGFGEGFDEDLLTQMADAGGGNAHYAETPDAAPAIFSEELEGLTSLAAQNVSVEIRPADEVEILGILNDYPQTEVPGGVQVALGDAYAGESRRVVFGLHIPRLGELGVARVAELVLRYVSVGDGVEQYELTIPVVANLVSADEAAAAHPDLKVREEIHVLRAARARKDAIDLADRGDFDAAQSSLRSVAAGLRSLPNAPVALLDEASMLEEAATSFDGDAYLASGASRKRLRYDSRRAQRGRRRPER